jgi:hypothetical protein
MNINILRIELSDSRPFSDLKVNEVVEDRVVLQVDGREMPFHVYIRAHPLPGVDASLVSGSSELENLLRFKQVALAQLCSMVGRVRRGEHLAMPFPLLRARQETAVGG